MMIRHCVILGLLSGPVWAAGKHLVKDPGFETIEGAWSGYLQGAAAFTPDREIKHSGEQSIRCENATAQDAAGAIQTVIANQETIIPIYVCGFSRAQEVSGPRNYHYGLWLDIEYVDDIRPGRVDDWLHLPFEVGTHDWQKVEATFTPKRPIKQFNLYTLFRRHKGTVWFDDVQAAQLSSTRLSGSPEDFTEPPEGLVPPGLSEEAGRASGDEMILFVRKEKLQDYHLDDLAVHLNGAPLERLAQDTVLWRGKPTYVSALEAPEATAPGLHIQPLIARWEESKLALTAVGKQGNAYHVFILLPEGEPLRRAEFENWEPSFDSVAAYRLGDRVLLVALLEVMTGSDTCRWVLLNTEMLAVPPVPARDHASEIGLQSGDDIRLHFSRTGALAAMTVQGTDLSLPEGSGGKAGWLSGEPGLYVGDLLAGKLLRAQGEPVVGNGEVTCRGTLHELNLEVHATYRAQGEAVLVEGEVTDLSGRDRSIDIVLKLPVVLGENAVFWKDLTNAARVADVGRIEMEHYPWLAVSDPDLGCGLALGISGEYPARQQIIYEPEGGLLHARLKFAVIHDAKEHLKGKVPFGFVIVPVDPEWGFRDAARRYYEAYPDLFACRPHREGLWMFGRLKDAEIPNPEDFSYFEGPSKLADYLREAGVLAAPYIIPNQRAITRLERLPEDYDEAMQMLEEYEPERPGWGGKGTREIIKASAIVDESGKHPIRIRDDIGADFKPDPPIFNVVFPVSPDPDLPSGADEMERIRAMVDLPDLGAVYTDSGSAWSARYLNFRRDHFPYADLPLTYDEETGQPAIFGKAPPVEHWRAMAEILHPAGKVVFPNLGHGFKDMWSYFAVDICGCEQGSTHTDFLNYSRTLAWHKPVLFLGYLKLHGKPTFLMEREGFERHVKRCAMMGIYPSIAIRVEYPEFYERDGDIYRLYVPIIKTLSAAGWEPVTHARINSPDVRVERFGPAEGVAYFTVYNDSAGAVDCTLEMDLPGLGAKGLAAIKDLVTQEEMEAGARVSLQLEPEQLRVLRLALAL